MDILDGWSNSLKGEDGAINLRILSGERLHHGNPSDYPWAKVFTQLIQETRVRRRANRREGGRRYSEAYLSGGWAILDP
jgi:hypothetical protein